MIVVFFEIFIITFKIFILFFLWHKLNLVLIYLNFLLFHFIIFAYWHLSLILIISFSNTFQIIYIFYNILFFIFYFVIYLFSILFIEYHQSSILLLKLYTTTLSFVIESCFKAKPLLRKHTLISFKANKKLIHFIHHANISIIKNVRIILPIYTLNLRNSNTWLVI